MADDKQMTSEEASVLTKEAADASVERDIAVYTALRASRREAEAIEGAKEQQAGDSIAIAQANDERDLAVESLTQATGREAVAKENARELRDEAVTAQVSAVRAADREDVAREDARAQHVEALSANAKADNMDTLRHLANARADSEASSGDRARSVIYILMLIILIMLVVIIWLLSTR